MLTTKKLEQNETYVLKFFINTYNFQMEQMAIRIIKQNGVFSFFLPKENTIKPTIEKNNTR